MADEPTLEQRIAALPGRKITIEHVQSVVRRTNFIRVPETTTIICALELRNGFVVIGHSACADPANFREDIGQELAFGKAIGEVWTLEAYLLREELWATAEVAEPAPKPPDYRPDTGDGAEVLT